MKKEYYNTLISLFPFIEEVEYKKSEEIIKFKLINTNNFKQITVLDDFWSSGPQNDRAWLWTVHSFSLLDPLISCLQEDYVNTLISTWMQTYSSQPLEADFPWHDHATALRLDRLSRMALVFSSFNFIELVKTHASILLKESFYSKHTNHGFDQSLSLIIASLAFEGVEGYLTWRKTGIARLKQEILFAFTEDGVHIENSPAYQIGMTNNLARARKLLSLAGENIDYLDDIFKKSLVFLAWITRPDRFVAFLGDSASYRPNVSNELSHFHEFDYTRWVSSGGQVGCALDQNSVIFEKAGYAIYRSNWSEWPGHTHIILKSGFLSRYHRHDDDLNILVHAFGEDWLIDSGLYNHNQMDSIRIYMRSALAHNVPYLPDVKVSRSNPGYASAYIRPIEIPEYEFSLDAFTRMYEGGRIRRRLMIKNDSYFRVYDKFLAHENLEKYWLFHFPKDKLITPSMGKAVVKGKGANLIIRCSNKEISCIKFVGNNPDFPSLISKKINFLEDSQVLVFGPVRDCELVFTFEFQKK